MHHDVLGWNGIINGMGSVGAVLQDLIIGKLYDTGAGQLGPIFLLLLGSSGLAVLVIGIINIRNRRGYSIV